MDQHISLETLNEAYGNMMINDVKIARIKAIFDTFDWEFDDKHYAMEEIQRIVNGA